MKRFAGIFLLITAAMTVVIFGCNKKTVQPEVVYLIDVFVGDVQVSHNGTDWIPAEVGMELKQADVIKTGDNSFCDIVMPNRGIFRVTYNSVVYLSKLTEKIEELEVRSGRIAVNVTEKLNDDETFNVATGTAVVAIRGTQFVLEIKPSGAFQTIVKEGTVNVKPAVALNNVQNEEVREQVDNALTVPVEENQAISLDSGQTEYIQELIDSEISDSSTPEEVTEVVGAAIEAANVEVVPADTETVSSEFSDIVGDQARERMQRRMQDYQESVEALNEAIQSVGGNMAEDVVGEGPSTREEDEAALQQQVDNVNSRVGSTGMAEDLVGEEPTTREEDEDTLDNMTSGIRDRGGMSSTTTVASGSSGSVTTTTRRRPGNLDNVLGELGE